MNSDSRRFCEIGLSEGILTPSQVQTYEEQYKDGFQNPTLYFFLSEILDQTSITKILQKIHGDQGPKPYVSPSPEQITEEELNETATQIIPMDDDIFDMPGREKDPTKPRPLYVEPEPVQGAASPPPPVYVEPDPAPTAAPSSNPVYIEPDPAQVATPSSTPAYVEPDPIHQEDTVFMQKQPPPDPPSPVAPPPAGAPPRRNRVRTYGRRVSRGAEPSAKNPAESAPPRKGGRKAPIEPEPAPTSWAPPPPVPAAPPVSSWDPPPPVEPPLVVPDWPVAPPDVPPPPVPQETLPTRPPKPDPRLLAPDRVSEALPSHERRGYVRFRSERVRLALFQAGLMDKVGMASNLAFSLADISLGGLSAVVNRELKPYSRIRATIEFPRLGQTLSLLGEVRWCGRLFDNNWEVGVIFALLSPEDHAVLRGWVHFMNADVTSA